MLGGRTLPPGVYKSTPGTYSIGAVADPVGSNTLTLDGKGDANAVWVFQAASSLTVGVTGPADPAPNNVKVLCINGCASKNVFWYVPSGATIGTGSTMVGTMLSNAAITFSTAGAAVQTTLNGRAIAKTAAVTMVTVAWATRLVSTTDCASTTTLKPAATVAGAV